MYEKNTANAYTRVISNRIISKCKASVALLEKLLVWFSRLIDIPFVCLEVRSHFQQD